MLPYPTNLAYQLTHQLTIPIYLTAKLQYQLTPINLSYKSALPTYPTNLRYQPTLKYKPTLPTYPTNEPYNLPCNHALPPHPIASLYRLLYPPTLPTDATNLPYQRYKSTLQI